jgi:hypothetical protein
MAKRATKLTKGWHFIDGDFNYYVGAKTPEDAKNFLVPQSAAAAQNAPEPLPVAVVRFFKLEEGSIVVGRVLAPDTIKTE